MFLLSKDITNMLCVVVQAKFWAVLFTCCKLKYSRQLCQKKIFLSGQVLNWSSLINK